MNRQPRLRGVLPVVEPRPRSLALLLGDLLVLSAFVAYGLLSHSINPLDYPRHAVMTALPFLIAWVLIAPPARLYLTRVYRSPKRAVVAVFVAWPVATLLGGAIRSTSLFHGGAPPDFLLVNAIIGLLFLLPWRLLVAGYWYLMR